VQWDAAEQILHFMVYRPVGPVYDYDGRPTCDVEERWATLTLG
jgi:hypothetical protein